MLKAKDLRDKSIEDLEVTFSDYQKELFQLINKNSLTKKAEKPHLVREKRKDIARLLTVMHEKQMAKQQSMA